jgi:hypothetical protein
MMASGKVRIKGPEWGRCYAVRDIYGHRVFALYLLSRIKHCALLTPTFHLGFVLIGMLSTIATTNYMAG